MISAADKDGNQRYYFADGLGSTMLTVGASQAPTYSYAVFADLRSGSPSGETFLFTGKQFDAKARHTKGCIFRSRRPWAGPASALDIYLSIHCR